MCNTRKPSCQIKFTQLEFGNVCLKVASKSYRQFHCRIIIDSQECSHIDESKPERSRFSEREVLITVSGKATETKAGSGAIGATTTGFNIGASGTYTRAAEEGTSSAIKYVIAKITKQAQLGFVWWGFDIVDTNLQQGGTVFEETERPTATFTFHPDADNHTVIPKEIDVEITTYWSIVPTVVPSLTTGWLHKIVTDGSSVAQYSHLCQMTALNIPTDLKQDSAHAAVLYVNTTGAGLQVNTDILRPGSKSVKIKSQVTRRTDSTSFDYGKFLPFMTSNILRRFFLANVQMSSLDLSIFRHQMAFGNTPQEQTDAQSAAKD
jgi:hypothetical protein